MVEIVSVNSEDLIFTIKGPLSDKSREKIIAICHEYKNLYMVGYPHGRKKRKKMAAAGVIYRRWNDYPGVTLCYIPKPTADNGLAISVIFPANANKGKTERALKYFAQLWQQDVIDTIVAEIA